MPTRAELRSRELCDSLAHSEHHRTIAVIDSAMRHIDFSFDTLKINIERPVEYAEAPEIIRSPLRFGASVLRRFTVCGTASYQTYTDGVSVLPGGVCTDLLDGSALVDRAIAITGAVFGMKYHYQYGHRQFDNSNQSHNTQPHEDN